ncbi:recombinase family protein [Acinetobacter sp. B10A]|uniref:recombinase family protein n=1 Tax=Acinetobacter baretiae TaxID=2605383 RepID=UPI001B3C6D62|nr:recombinase family protein [Acinetobacter baretiae]MBF7686492.1 recombinase family protein [Acinetobacter baretiae]
MVVVRIYVRASTKDQDAERALADLVEFSQNYASDNISYVENFSGTLLNRPQLNRLLNESKSGDVLLVESVDRLSRLSQQDFEILKHQIKQKGLKLIVADLPTTHHLIKEGITGDILSVINAMLIDLLATMARLDNDKRKERIKQGLLRSGYKPQGKAPNRAKHARIKQLLALETMTKEEVAKAVGVGVATVYRVAKLN